MGGIGVTPKRKWRVVGKPDPVRDRGGSWECKRPLEKRGELKGGSAGEKGKEKKRLGRPVIGKRGCRRTTVEYADLGGKPHKPRTQKTKRALGVYKVSDIPKKPGLRKGGCTKTGATFTKRLHLDRI